MWADTCKHMPELAEEKSNVYATVTGSFVLTAIIKKRKKKRKIQLKLQANHVFKDTQRKAYTLPT